MVIFSTIDYSFSTLHFPSLLKDIKSAVKSISKSGDVNYIRFIDCLRAKDIIIMQLVADGFTLLQIADKIGLCNRTVEQRILRLRKKLNCKNITHLAIMLLRAKVIK